MTDDCSYVNLQRETLPIVHFDESDFEDYFEDLKDLQGSYHNILKIEEEMKVTAV